MTLSGFQSLEALSAEACKPFAADRCGLNIGEGGALLLVENQGEGCALLEAVGESSDAYHITAPHPEGAGAHAAMSQALDRAGLSADDISHINAHGTGTRLNDAAEARAIYALFGSEVPVVSTKGYTGHTLGAAGATEACLALISLQEGRVPLSLGSAPLDAALKLNVVSEGLTTPQKHVLSNSFAFGGNNVSVLLGAA